MGSNTLGVGDQGGDRGANGQWLAISVSDQAAVARDGFSANGASVTLSLKKLCTMLLAREIRYQG